MQSSWHGRAPALRAILRDPHGRVAQGPDRRKGAVRLALAVAVVDEHRLAAGAMSGFDIAPAVARRCSWMPDRCSSPGRLPAAGRAWACGMRSRGVVVRANLHVVELQIAVQPAVDFGNLRCASIFPRAISGWLVTRIRRSRPRVGCGMLRERRERTRRSASIGGRVRFSVAQDRRG